MGLKRLVEKESKLNLPLTCSFGDQVSLLGDKNLDDGHQRKKILKMMRDPLKIDGACGPIMRSMTIKLTGSENPEIDWCFLHPCALLHGLCKACPGLGDLLRNVGEQRVAVYMDEIKPGNVLRPDPGQSVAMWYWTLMDFPAWYLSRNEGWFYFAAFPSKLIDKVDGGYSFLFAKMMEIFFQVEEPFNFHSGFPCMSTAGIFICQGSFGGLLSDEKSITSMWSLRGASGTKPCCFCQNVVGHMTRAQVQTNPWLVHYSCCFTNKFSKHTSSTFRDMRDRLEAVSGNKKECNRMGQAFGLQFKQLGILWHPSLREMVCPVKHTYYDWMHVLVASGGVAQYECNELLKIIKGQGISLQQVDLFASQLVLPKRYNKLPKTFFQDRVNFDDNTCLRCFAADMLVCIQTLVLFNDIVLEPLGILTEHRQCFQWLADIVDILTQGPWALEFLPELSVTIAKHNDLYFKLYPDCCKPKYHWLFHVPENLKTFQVNLSCFNPERKHRATKAIASHVFNQHLQHHVTMRIAHATLLHFDEGKVCKETFLDGPKRSVDDGIVFESNEIMSLQSARRLVTATGSVSVGDCVFDHGMARVMFPQKFLEVKFMSGRNKFICQAACHKHIEKTMFEGCYTEILVDWESTFRVVPFTLRANGLIHACLQAVAQDQLRNSRR